MAGPGHRPLNHHRPTKFFSASCDIERMQTCDIVRGRARNFLCSGDEIHGIGTQIDDGRALDADVSHNVEIVDTDNVYDRNRGNSGTGIRKVDAPEDAAVAGIRIRIEGIHNIIHGDDKQNVVSAKSGDR